MSNSFKRPLFWASIVAVGGIAAFFGRRKFASTPTIPKSAAKPSGNKALNPKEFVAFKLVSVKHESQNSAIFRFAFPNETDIAGMPIASCLVVKYDDIEVDAKIGESKPSAVVRPYTPINDPQDVGYLDLLIKKYPNGKMSQHIFNMKPGDELQFKGPFEKILYESNKWQHVGMLAGGTGITPMWQVIKKALSDPADKTKLTLLYANVSVDDILLKKELDELAAKHADRFKVYYAIDKADKKSSWSGFTGYINEQMYASANLPRVSDSKSMVFVCGNDPMMKSLSGPKAKDKSQGEIDPASLLGKLGFDKEHVYKF